MKTAAKIRSLASVDGKDICHTICLHPDLQMIHSILYIESKIAPTVSIRAWAIMFFWTDTNVFHFSLPITNADIIVLLKQYLYNKLSLNYSKTVYMIFNSDKKQGSPFRVQIGSNQINRVHSTKYLGMHLDNKLNWDTHISKLESKLSCYSGIFYRIREYLSTNELKMIYFSLVYSHLQYAIGAWGSAIKTSLHRLNTIHNKIIKTISWSSFRCHVTPAYSQLNLLKIEDIHQLEISKLMHNFHSNRMPNTFDRLFTAVHSVHTHEARSSANTSVTQSAPNMEKDQSNSKAQESGSK